MATVQRKAITKDAVVVSDAFWTWAKRGATAAGAIGAAVWWFFGFYNQVQGLGTKVDALWTGQGTIMATIAEVKTSVAAIAQQGSRPHSNP